MKKIGGAVILGERSAIDTAEEQVRAAAEAAEAQLQAVLTSVAAMDTEQKLEWVCAQVFDLARQVNGIIAALPGMAAGLDELFRWRGHMEEFEGRVTGQLLLGSVRRGN